MPTRSYEPFRVRIIHANGIWHVGAFRGQAPPVYKAPASYIRCASFHEANTHSLIASAFVWAFQRLDPYLGISVS